jgi:Ca2+:H+ antiporter
MTLGCCYFASGIRGGECCQNSSLDVISRFLLFATAALIVPPSIYTVTTVRSVSALEGLVAISRGISILLLILYIVWLIFTLKTHADLFDDEEMAEDAEESKSLIGPFVAIFVIATVLVLTVVCAFYLVNSACHIETVTHSFLWFVLIPIAPTVASFIIAVILGSKGKLDLAFQASVGSSLDIVLLIIPFLVILGWCIGKPLDLDFNLFEASSTVLATVLSHFIAIAGKSSYLDGISLSIM